MKKVIISLFILLVASIIFFISLYIYFLSPVSSKSQQILFEIKKGETTTSILKKLEDNNLIKNDTVALIYMKLHSNLTIKAGTYNLDLNMGTKKILEVLNLGNTIEKQGIKVTFVEGKTINDYATIIEDKLNIPKEEFLNTINNKIYLEELIDKYWFITDEILNEKIYIPLEGYLYPDTYYFDINTNSKDIVNKMLNNLAIKIDAYKDLIKNSNYTFHEILSLASDIEIEGNTLEDRKLIAGVFLNRLKINMSLGSDVTTYYAVGKSLKEELWLKDLNTENAYNTRGPNMAGKINIGPICNPEIESIKSILEPTISDYLYFYADYLHDGKVYYSRTLYEHNQTVSKFES